MDQFKGLKVLELASVLAGPSVGQFFAELGADVIKVENPSGGDVTRSWKTVGEEEGDLSAYFCAVNWGKRSVVADLSSGEGQEVVHKLAARSDIVIVSFKAGDAEKLRADYRSLSANNPRLIYGQITGYGAHNRKVGYDALIQAESGFMSMNGTVGGPSLKMPVALMDLLAGHQLKEGLLLALLEREKTGKGKLVDVSLFHSAVASLANQATNWLIAGKLPGKQGSAHPNIAPYGDIFITADGQEVILAVGNDRQFADLCRILGADTLVSDDRFRTNSARVKHRMDLVSELQSRIASMSVDVLVNALDSARVPGGVIKNIAQVFEHSLARDIMLEAGALRSVRTYVANVSEQPGISPPPRLGQHTAEVLAQIAAM